MATGLIRLPQGLQGFQKDESSLVGLGLVRYDGGDPLGDRLMVGHQTLDLRVQVRILVPQPRWKHLTDLIWLHARKDSGGGILPSTFAGCPGFTGKPIIISSATLVGRLELLQCTIIK
jgi:hypothetical protein